MRGTAFADFESVQEAHLALGKLHGQRLFNRTLSATFAQKPCSKLRHGESVSVPIAPDLGINWSFPSDLQYKYPPITEATLQNIANAIVAVPQLYIQVCHLMNKMNLPPPFGTTSPTPSMARLDGKVAEEAASESESDDDFEGEQRAPRSLSNLPPEMRTQPAKKPKPLPMTINIQGQLQPVPERPLSPSSYRKVISRAVLQSQRMSEAELPQKFKNYQPGQPSKKLYIKNLSKDTTEEDLRFIFGRFFPTDQDVESNMITQLMTKGRMRGQAFITFPTIEVAQQALKAVHGFVVNEKPMIIQFGKTDD